MSMGEPPWQQPSLMSLNIERSHTKMYILQFQLYKVENQTDRFIVFRVMIMCTLREEGKDSNGTGPLALFFTRT